MRLNLGSVLLTAGVLLFAACGSPVNETPNLIVGEPAVNAPVVSTPEDTPIEFDVSVTAQTDVALAIVSQPRNGTFELLGDHRLRYTPDGDWFGDDMAMVEVSGPRKVTATVSLTVTPVNDAPTGQSQSLETSEDTSLGGALRGNDVEGDNLSFAFADMPTAGTATLDSVTGEFTYTPNENYHGADGFTFVVSDGELESRAQTVVIGVLPMNDVPVAQPAALETDEDTPVGGVFSASDIDGDTLSFALAAAPVSGSVDVNAETGAFTYTPFANVYGVDRFTYSADDGELSSLPVTVSVTISPVNDAPNAVSADVETSEDVSVGGTVTALDVEGDTLEFGLAVMPDNGTVELNRYTGAFTYVPDADFFGTDAFTFTASDPLTSSVPATVTITVSPVNDAPVAADADYEIDEDDTLWGSLAHTDVDGDEVTFTITSQPAHGTLVVDNDGSFVYVPEPDWNGDDSFTWQVFDGSLSDSAVVSITVNAVDDAPRGVEATTHVAKGGAAAGQLSYTDDDGTAGPVTFSVTAAPFGGTLAVTEATGEFVYTTTNATFSGYDRFNFLALDGSAVSEPAPHWVAVGCLDEDGDGYGLNCTAGPDCNDNDPTVFPGAPELPDNGILESCTGPELSVDDASGIFVDPVSGDDANAGTQAAPVAGWDRALDLAESAGKVVFLAGGEYDSAAPRSIAVSVFGGFDRFTWERNLALNPTTITTSGARAFNMTASAGSPQRFDGIDVVGGSPAIRMEGAGILSHCRVRPTSNPDPFELIVSDAVDVANGASAVIAHCDIGGGQGGNARAVVITGTATIWESLLSTISGEWQEATVAAYGVDARVHLVGNQITAEGAAPWNALVRAETGPYVYLRNNLLVLHGDTTASALTIDGGTIMAVNNTVDIEGYHLSYNANNGPAVMYMVNNIFKSTATQFMSGWGSKTSFYLFNNLITGSPWGFDDCSFAGCAASSGNLLSADPGFAAEGYGLAAGSPAIDAGMDTRLIPDGLYPVSYDHGGTVRNGTLDIGAWEWAPPED